MSGRILVVDDIEANRRLLQARLEAEYFEVSEACDGEECLAAVAAEAPDIILLDVMMPKLDGFATCRRLKQSPETSHIPVVLVTALDSQSDRVTGLEAGADEFLTKPIDDIILFARVRNLLRLKSGIDELRRREANGRALGAIEATNADPDFWRNARILVVGDEGRPMERLMKRLRREHRPQIEHNPREAAQLARNEWDLAIIDLAAETHDAMRLAARLRSDEHTRSLPILALTDAFDRERMVRALDVGVNDILFTPLDPQELAARVRTQMRRKSYTDYLRAMLDQGLEMAVTDQLTGLNNRRYMMTKLTELVEKAGRKGESLAVLICDLDHFKCVNDTHGHDAGDEVLRQFAHRMSGNVRAVDMSCRYGGEEFVVVMPNADADAAQNVGERVRASVASTPFALGEDGGTLDASVSIGAALFQPGDSVEYLLKRADEALYAAKEGGRNCVVMADDERKAA